MLMTGFPAIEFAPEEALVNAIKYGNQTGTT